VITGSESFYAMTLSLEHANINAIFHALEEYGQLSVLSNPRLKAMNGQSAIMSVGQSVAYLATVERDVDGETGDITYTTEIDSVFDGVLLGITPVIEKNDIITLHIVPIKSDLVELKTVTIGDNATQITLPMVNLREMSTVARVNSGDIVLLGGLIMESTDDNESGLPFLSDIPVLGRLFNYETQTKRRVELVVALQVKVIENY
jgi:type II secretory pathway component GspD/PulD (secretin)